VDAVNDRLSNAIADAERRIAIVVERLRTLG